MNSALGIKPGAQREKVFARHLAIDQGHLLGAQRLDEVAKRDLRGVPLQC